jgi:hypothetical protein
MFKDKIKVHPIWDHVVYEENAPLKMQVYERNGKEQEHEYDPFKVKIKVKT